MYRFKPLKKGGPKVEKNKCSIFVLESENQKGE
jgi:hypothetical protein